MNKFILMICSIALLILPFTASAEESQDIKDARCRVVFKIYVQPNYSDILAFDHTKQLDKGEEDMIRCQSTVMLRDNTLHTLVYKMISFGGGTLKLESFTPLE